MPLVILVIYLYDRLERLCLAPMASMALLMMQRQPQHNHSTCSFPRVRFGVSNRSTKKFDTRVN